MDFYTIARRTIEKGPNKGELELYPDYLIRRSKDLMVRAKTFYAVWDAEAGLWSTDEYDIQRLMDEELNAEADECRGICYIHGRRWRIRTVKD